MNPRMPTARNAIPTKRAAFCSVDDSVMTLPSFRTTEGVVVSSPAAVKPGRLLASIGGKPTVTFDETQEQIECVGVPGDTLGFKNVMVPVSGAQLTSDGLQLPYRKDQLRDFGDADGELDAGRWEQERGYYAAYDSGANRGTTQDADASLTRSEEELHVGTEQAQSGQVRLRKYVETEPVEAQVELQRETVDVERRPVDREVSGADFEEKEVAASLHEERPVVEKQAVAKEEVSLSKNV